MEKTGYEHGVPSWCDLGADLQKAKPFYAALFGWDIQEGPPEAGGYSLAHLRGKTVCGLGPQQNPGPPYWTTYINVNSADDVVKLAKANGGTVYVEPMDVMDVGRMAIVADPTGAVFGLWQPGEHKGAQLVNEPGTMCWNELITTDTAAAEKFYRAVFGWGAETHKGEIDYTEWKVGGQSVGGMMAKTPMMPAEMPSNWGVYFAVIDTDATCAKAKSLGGSIIMPPTDIEPGRFAVLVDPAGAPFNVIAMKEPMG
jgi:predicted enzyme related to lactoylglutathione lyase